MLQLMRILGKDFKECQAHRDPHMRYSLAADNRGRAVAQVKQKMIGQAGRGAAELWVEFSIGREAN